MQQINESQVAGLIADLATRALAADTGSKTDLVTTNKSTLVAAINEVKTAGGTPGPIGATGAPGATGPQGQPGVAFLIPTNMPTAQYATTALGLSGTTNGTLFGVPSANSNVIRVYLNVSGAAVYQRTMPFTALADFTFIKNSIDYKTLGRLPNYPILDFDSSEIFKSSQKIKNLATGYLPDERFLGTDFAPSAAGGGVITTGAPDSNGGATGFQVVLAAQSSTGSQPNFISFNANSSQKIPTGQWTLAWDVALPASTANTPMRYIANWAGGGFGTAVTLTTAWQTFSVTKSNTGETDLSTLFGAYTMAMAQAEVTPTTAVTLYICNIRFVAGATATALPAPPPQTDVYAPPLYPKISDVASGLFFNPAAMGAGSGMPFKLATPTPFTAFSFACAVNLTSITGNHNVIANQFGSANLLDIQSGVVISSGFLHIQAPSALPINQWLVIVATGDSRGCDIYVNNVLVYSTTTALTPQTISEWILFNYNAGFTFSGYVSTLAFWAARLSKAEVNQCTTTLINRIVTKGGSYHDIKTYLIMEGDSITASNILEGLVDAQFTPVLSSTNYAVSGAGLGHQGDSGVNTLWSRFPVVSADISGQLAIGRNIIFYVLIGANDISGLTTSALTTTYYANLVSYWTAMRSLGAKIVVCTVLDQTALTDKTYLNQLNGLIRGDATKYDGLADYNASASLTPATSTYYLDGEHPNTAGNGVMAAIVTPKITALWMA